MTVAVFKDRRHNWLADAVETKPCLSSHGKQKNNLAEATSFRKVACGSSYTCDPLLVLLVARLRRSTIQPIQQKSIDKEHCDPRERRKQCCCMLHRRQLTCQSASLYMYQE